MRSLSPDLKRLLADAAADARSGGNRIGTEHLLAALVVQGDSDVAAAFAHGGVTAKSVADARTRLFGLSPTLPASSDASSPQVTVFASAARKLVDDTLAGAHPTAAELAIRLVSDRSSLAAGVLRAIMDGHRVPGLTTQQRIDHIVRDLEALR